MDHHRFERSFSLQIEERVIEDSRLPEDVISLIAFYFRDVRPAIRTRRETPRPDIISHLLRRGYSSVEIMTECMTYAGAGMVTTREFMALAFWHILKTPLLRERMRVGSQAERYAILHELLRLEPIVGSIDRKTTAPLTFVSGAETHTIPAGTTVFVNVYAANLDETTVGAAPLAVCPHRPMASPQGKVLDSVLSFGEGAHRCPGAYVAIQETDIFLQTLLALPNLHIEHAPHVHYTPTTSGYEVDSLMVTVGG